MPDRWEDLSAAQQWKKNPNRRARQLKKAKAIRDDVKEPEYALRDAEIRDGLFKLMDQMQRLGKAFFAGDVDHPDAESEDVLPATFYRQFTRETAKIIGCVASGGPSGQYGWHSLFLDGQKRRTLVCAIIGNVLTEQVFQHMFFGGTADQIQAILQLQVKHRNQDGFIRNKLYAAAIRAALPEPKRIPPNFNNHVNAIVASLWTHLSPILHLTDRTATLTAIFPALQTLVTHAGLLSLHMRLDPHTVYYHEPTFKEDTFSAARMDCSNYRQMQQQHPRSSIDEVTNDERARRDALSTAETNRAKGDKPLTQIIILDCITAYRLGGWEAPTSNIVSPVYEWPEFKNLGVRARVLFPACVFCRWGRERAFGSLSSFGTRASQAKGDEAEAEKVKNEQGRRVHGTAWREGGFIEFTDVDGVFDWLGEERRERKALSDAAVAKAKAEAAAGTQERAGAGGAVAGEKEEDDEALLEALGLLPAPTGKGKTRDKANDKGKGKAKAVGSPGVQSIDVPEDTTPDWM
ncbi:hypothetical protein BDW02DRAFT_496271 [Decorospora gaudefroyi]|uniref:Uncharacterized protein n=1 Tax=Decorospora gaudefroyi TaxID=184978 RepID=A0A6A5KID8_9PLEO|nr:hypothetical protein BDW02DRAFT_496271 [Decorospora gaudefroyi]